MMEHLKLTAPPILAAVMAVCAAWAVASPTERTVSNMAIPNLPAHPRLLMNSEGIAEMKDRIQRLEWARARWNAIKSRADQALEEKIELPPRGGNWYHWYACPEHGCPLRTGKQIGQWQWEHVCPVGGETLRSDPAKPSTDYDGCALSRVHDGWARAVLDLGLAYQVTSEVRYADKARDILLAYAAKYQTYPLHNIHGEAKIGGGRVGSQQLDESVWLIPLCQGADLVWNRLSQSDRETISSKLLLPAAKEVILPNPIGVHNIQCWRNSAIGLVGFLLDDKELIRTAIDDPHAGFRTQMQKGVTADGQWWEGAWGYHFYTMSAIWPLTEAARNCGIDLYCPEYKRMFDAPLKFAMPNMHLPAFNDSGESSVMSAAPDYELAYARYKDPLCLELLTKSDRRNDFALWFGVPKLPHARKVQRSSANYPRSGYAILTKGKGNQATWLCMKYGPHGGGHGHPDKLSFVLYAKGHVIGIDPGTCRYGLPIRHEWYTTTLAHNTLTIDEHSQKPAQGRCTALGAQNGVDYAVCEAGPIHEGVRFTRTAALVGENLLVFVDQIRADAPHTLDIAYHELGRWKDLPRGTAWTPTPTPGYQCLKDASVRTTDNGITLEAEVSNDLGVAIGLAAGEPTQVITATGVGADIADRVPVSIFRRQAKDTAFVWFVSLDGKPPRVETLEVSDSSARRIDPSVAVGVKVTQPGLAERLLIVNPTKRAVVVSLSDGTQLRTRSAFVARQQS
jgi:hypothetical protein